MDIGKGAKKSLRPKWKTWGADGLRMGWYAGTPI